MWDSYKHAAIPVQFQCNFGDNAFGRMPDVYRTAIFIRLNARPTCGQRDPSGLRPETVHAS